MKETEGLPPGGMLPGGMLPSNNIKPTSSSLTAESLYVNLAAKLIIDGQRE